MSDAYRLQAAATHADACHHHSQSKAQLSRTRKLRSHQTPCLPDYPAQMGNESNLSVCSRLSAPARPWRNPRRQLHATGDGGAPCRPHRLWRRRSGELPCSAGPAASRPSARSGRRRPGVSRRRGNDLRLDTTAMTVLRDPADARRHRRHARLDRGLALGLPALPQSFPAPHGSSGRTRRRLVAARRCAQRASRTRSRRSQPRTNQVSSPPSRRERIMPCRIRKASD